MLRITALIVAFLLSQIARSAPTNALDPNTLLQNGLAAQDLNTEFRRLKVTDACTSGQTACIDGAIATCQNNAWTTQQCFPDQRCFVLPSVRDAGTFVTCTSVAKALSIISATGATGGIFASDTNTTSSVAFPTAAETANVAVDTNTASDTGSISASATGTSTADASAVTTVTVTVVVGANGATITDSPGTTLTPDQVTSLLSGLSVDRTATAPPDGASATPTDTSDLPGTTLSPEQVTSLLSVLSVEQTATADAPSSASASAVASTTADVAGALAAVTIELSTTPVTGPTPTASATGAPPLPYDY